MNKYIRFKNFEEYVNYGHNAASLLRLQDWADPIIRYVPLGYSAEFRSSDTIAVGVVDVVGEYSIPIFEEKARFSCF